MDLVGEDMSSFLAIALPNDAFLSVLSGIDRDTTRASFYQIWVRIFFVLLLEDILTAMSIQGQMAYKQLLYRVHFETASRHSLRTLSKVWNEFTG